MTTDTTTAGGAVTAQVSYKYQRLRERLRRAIQTGELSGKLPGERILGQRYDANAKTVNKALSDLTAEGLLSRQVGRGTYVAGSEVPAFEGQPAGRRFGWLVSSDGNGTDADYLYNRARGLLERQGCRLEQVIDASKERDLHCGRLKSAMGFIAVGQVPALRLLAGIQRRHLPVVLANNIHNAGRVSAVTVDYAHGAFELTQHLIQLGHEEVTLAVDPNLLPAAGAARLGYEAALKRYSMACLPVCTVSHGGLPDLRGAWVCVGTKAAAAVLDQAAKAGLRVPGQLAVAVIAEPGATLPTERNLTAYETDRDRIIDWATELLLSATPGARPQLVFVPGRVCLRNSTATRGRASEAPLPTPDATVL